MRTLAVLALAAVAAMAAEVDYSFAGNLSNADADFKFRFTEVYKFDEALGWVAGSVDAKTADKQAQANANMVAGVATTYLGAPVIISFYVKGQAELSLMEMAAIAEKVQQRQSIGAGYQYGMMGLAILEVQEVDGNGIAIKNHSLISKDWKSLTSHCGEYQQGKVYAYSTETKDGNDLKVSFTTANVAGVLKYANAPVSPSSLEVILENKGLKLSDKNNRFRVKVALFSYTRSKSFSGGAMLCQAADGEQVYAAVSGKVEVDGQVVEASIKFDENGQIDPSLDFSNLFGSNYAMTMAYVDFPKGEENFIYDPSVGVGRVVYDGSATTAVLSFVALLFCAVAAFF